MRRPFLAIGLTLLASAVLVAGFSLRPGTQPASQPLPAGSQERITQVHREYPGTVVRVESPASDEGAQIYHWYLSEDGRRRMWFIGP